MKIDLVKDRVKCGEITTTTKEDEMVKQLFGRSIEDLASSYGGENALHALSKALPYLGADSERVVGCLEHLTGIKNYAAEAHHDLGVHYAKEAKGFFSDDESRKKKSSRHFYQAFELGSQPAQYELALLYRDGEFFDDNGNKIKNEARYVELLNGAAKSSAHSHGDKRAMCELIAYHFAKGSPQSIDESEVIFEYDRVQSKSLDGSSYCPKSYYPELSEKFLETSKISRDLLLKHSADKSLTTEDLAAGLLFSCCEGLAKKAGSGLAFYEMSKLYKVGLTGVPKDDLLAFQCAAAAKMRGVRGIESKFFGGHEYREIDLNSYGDFGVDDAKTPEQQQALKAKFTGVIEYINDQRASCQIPEEKQLAAASVVGEVAAIMNERMAELDAKISPPPVVAPTRDSDYFTPLLPRDDGKSGGNVPY